MHISELFATVVSFAKANPIIALAVSGILLFFIYRRPALSFFVLFIIVLLAGAYYVILSMSSSAGYEKNRLLQKDAAPQEIIRIDPSRMLH